VCRHRNRPTWIMSYWRLNRPTSVFIPYPVGSERRDLFGSARACRSSSCSLPERGLDLRWQNSHTIFLSFPVAKAKR
jgi:hypothetical protein